MFLHTLANTPTATDFEHDSLRRALERAPILLALGGLAAEWTAETEFGEALTHIMGPEEAARIRAIMDELQRVDRDLQAAGMENHDLPALATDYRLAYQAAAFHLGLAMGAMFEAGTRGGIPAAMAAPNATRRDG